MTDTAGGYHARRQGFCARHEMVDHGKDEYVRGDAHSNTVEGYFSILKRGLMGVITTSAKPICTAILPSSISGIRTAKDAALMT